MLIARAPLRISLAGGGTDLEAYSARFGGAVVSATIDKYFYVIVTLSESGHIQVSSSDYHSFFRQRVDDQAHLEGELRLPKAVLAHFGMRTGVSIFLASQVPPGTGLGSSSTVAVALIKAVALLCGERLSASEVAELACEIEIERLGMPIGRQDQYAAAFGGLNFYEFDGEGTRVDRLDVPIEAVIGLQDRLMLFFTGVRHDSGRILDSQRRNCSNRGETVDALHTIKALALKVRDDLVSGDISRIGVYLHESWLAKRTLADGISDPLIDRWYEVARAAGAAGGKIAGAGGGGFLLLYCEPESQDRVTEELHARGLTRMDFRFEAGGAMVILNNMVGTLSASRSDALAYA